MSVSTGIGQIFSRPAPASCSTSIKAGPGLVCTDCDRDRMQILEAQQRIAAGEHFATVAGEMSEDKARQGGDLGWKGRQEVVGDFAEAALKLEVCVLDR